MNRNIKEVRLAAEALSSWASAVFVYCERCEALGQPKDDIERKIAAVRGQGLGEALGEARAALRRLEDAVHA